LIAIGVCFALASCGAGGGIAALASQDLNDRVAAIRAAVEDGNPELAQVLLERLQDEVDRWLAEGVLPESRAAMIQSAAGDVLALLPADALVSESPTPSPEPSEDGDEGEDHDNSGPGNGEGHGNSGPGHGGDSGKD
jgi:hypothetical protein